MPHPSPRHTRADEPRCDRVPGVYPGVLSRAIPRARHGAVRLRSRSLYPPPARNKPKATAARAAGKISHAPPDAHDAPHARAPPAAQHFAFA